MGFLQVELSIYIFLVLNLCLNNRYRQALEMRNDYLDRALVVPVLGLDGAAFFPAPP